MCTKNPKGQEYLLRGLETIIGMNQVIRTKLLNKKQMLKTFLKLYEKDIVDEDVFYLWHAKVE
jgi:hypothetical protein